MRHGDVVAEQAVVADGPTATIADLAFAVESLGLVADVLWEAYQRAVTQRATTVSMTLEQAAILVDGVEAARKLGRRGAAW